MLKPAGTYNHRGDNRVCHQPSRAQCRDRYFLLLCDLLNLPNGLELSFVPIPTGILFPSPAELIREAAFFRRHAVFVFSGQKSTGEWIVRSDSDCFFLRQSEKFALNFPKQQIVTRLDANETRQLPCILKAKCSC